MTTQQIASTLTFVGMLCATFVAAPHSAHAYSFKVSKSGNQVHWRKQQIEIRVQAAKGQAGIELMEAARVAAQAWGAVENAPKVKVSSGASLEWGFDPSGKNENGVYTLDAWPFPQGQLATTITTTVEQTGEVVDSDILVNREYDVALLPDEHDKGFDSVFDLGAILTHEIGHMLGLDHSQEDKAATMYHQIRPGDIGQRTLEDDDLLGLEAAYQGMFAPDNSANETPIGSDTLASSDSAETITAGACSAGGTMNPSILFLFAVVAALLFLRRRNGETRVASTVAGRAVSFAVTLAAVGCTQGSPDGEHRPVVEGSVQKLEAHWDQGVIWTNYRVTTTDGAKQFLRLPGGKLDGLVQHVGHHELPKTGDVVAVRIFDALERDDIRSRELSEDKKQELAPRAWLVPNGRKVYELQHQHETH